jgi:hypothetical protein
MFFKSKAPEKDRNAAANTAEVIERMVQQQHSVAEQVAASPPAPKAGTGSYIGSGMWIVGNIECKGQAQVFGRIEGELRGSDLLISNGAPGSHPTGKGMGVDDIRLVPAARSEKRCPRLEIQSWRSGKAGAPEYRRLRGRRLLGMTSAADIAAPGRTIQRAHERSFLLLSIVSYSNADVSPVVAQSFYVVQVVMQV